MLSVVPLLLDAVSRLRAAWRSGGNSSAMLLLQRLEHCYAESFCAWVGAVRSVCFA